MRIETEREKEEEEEEGKEDMGVLEEIKNFVGIVRQFSEGGMRGRSEEERGKVKGTPKRKNMKFWNPNGEVRGNVV